VSCCSVNAVRELCHTIGFGLRAGRRAHQREGQDAGPVHATVQVRQHCFAASCLHATCGVAAASCVNRQKFSSNVVERCLKQSSPQWRALIISELISQQSVAELLRDRYGNYVLQVREFRGLFRFPILTIVSFCSLRPRSLWCALPCHRPCVFGVLTVSALLCIGGTAAGAGHCQSDRAVLEFSQVIDRASSPSVHRFVSVRPVAAFTGRMFELNGRRCSRRRFDPVVDLVCLWDCAVLYLSCV
jgi:hypothetical protein